MAVLKNLYRGGLKGIALACCTLMLLTSAIIPPAASADDVKEPACAGEETTGEFSADFTRAGKKGTVTLLSAESGNLSSNVRFQIDGAPRTQIQIVVPGMGGVTHCISTSGTPLLIYKIAGARQVVIEILREEGVMRTYAYAFASIETTGAQQYSAPMNKRNITINSLNKGWGSFTPKGAVGSFDFAAYSSSERGITLDANNGAWADGSTSKYQIINTQNLPITENRPTRQGYQLKTWNSKADGTGLDISTNTTSLQDGQTVYAIWEKDAGKPTDVRIDCINRTNGGALCSVVTRYADNISRKRELNATSDGSLAWSGDGAITGVRLDVDGYNADNSCVVTSNGNGQCYYVSLSEKPDATPTGYVAATPQTGDPAASWRQTITYLMGGLLVLLAGLTVLNVKRQARRL